MYPLFRSVYFLKRKLKKIDSIWTQTTIKMRVWPGDIDLFLELNNGRYLTLMDFGRFDYFRRLDWPRINDSSPWQGAVAGVSIRYRKRLTLLQTFHIHTRLVALDDRWWYFTQTLERENTIHASALIRFAVLKEGRSMTVDQVEQSLGKRFERKMPDWVKAWHDSDEMRPWTPTSEHT